MRMRMTGIIIFLILAPAPLLLVSCGHVSLPPKAREGHLLTDSRMSAIENSLYTNKQVQVFVSAINARQLALMLGRSDSELLAARAAVREMSEALNEFRQINPALGMDDMKEDTVVVMEQAIKHMEEYAAIAGGSGDTAPFNDIFTGDILNLTSMAELYNQ